MRVLVTGGAGYIGSVVCEELLQTGHSVVVYDNLIKGHRGAVCDGIPLIQADLSDYDSLLGALKTHRIEAVIHLAADALVGESVVNPSKYYRSNVLGGLSVIDAMRDCEVSRLVFSSTAAVYGQPDKQPIEEEDPTRPTNPYGETKLAFERALSWYETAYGLSFASLRYFNAAGASTRNGEVHDPETHLIPLVLQAAAGKGKAVTIYGDAYPTRDGTCVRDYIHVMDLARAHVLALVMPGERSATYNLGCGAGHTVREVIEAARQVTKREIPVDIGARRQGDPPILIASPAKIKRELGWEPRIPKLEEIVDSAWKWMKEHPNGYNR